MSNRRRLQGRHFQDYVTSIHLSRSPLIDLIFVLSVALYAYRLSPFALLSSHQKASPSIQPDTKRSTETLLSDSQA